MPKQMTAAGNSLQKVKRFLYTVLSAINPQHVFTKIRRFLVASVTVHMDIEEKKQLQPNEKGRGPFYRMKVHVHPRRTPNRPFDDPIVERGDKISWHAPADRPVAIVLPKESPFTVADDIIYIPKGQTKEAEISRSAEQGDTKYEYGVMVQMDDLGRDYRYAKGQNSPPGVVVGP